MLCQFSFKNFRSYKNQTVFDLQSTLIPEFRESLLESENDSSKRFLPVSVLYGPNGGGKSNVLFALSYLILLVARPIKELRKNKTEFIFIPDYEIEAAPFLLDDISKNVPTDFEIFFRTMKNEYRYILSTFKEEVVEEYLFRRAVGGKKTATIFERHGSTVNLGASINKSTVNTAVNPKMPYLPFLAINYNFDVITEVQEWFESCVIQTHFAPDSKKRVLSEANDNFKIKLLGLLNDMGINIEDYRFDDLDHRFYVKRKVDGKFYELDFSLESDGTKKLFDVLPTILISLLEGRLAIIDELDVKLHPKLLRYIIMLFKNPDVNKYGAQLLFTSHDLATMKNDVFRRDEIWFAAKIDDESSEIYSLYEIRKEDNTRIKSTAAYDKQYFEGRYGADPYLANMLTWEVKR